MTYEIHSKSDFQVGMTLTVKIPYSDLDRKALYTIESDSPAFLLPFRYRIINGEVEFTYQVGNRSKLAYVSGNRTPFEYADMWIGLLQPLLDCDDWFMSPTSFVLSPEYLYYDKLSNAINFVYIPSICTCSDEQALKNMVTEVARMNHVTDAELENKIIWGIQDFNVNSFLQMAKDIRKNKTDTNTPQAPLSAMQENVIKDVQTSDLYSPLSSKQNISVPTVNPSPDSFHKSDDEIVINFASSPKTEKHPKQKKGLFGGRKAKGEETKTKNRPLWGRKNEREIIGGAVAQSIQAPFISENIPDPSSTGYALSVPIEDADDVTVVDQMEPIGTRFQYIGIAEHPKLIEISIEEGAIFTIGRFDTSVGIQQSSFEFPPKTRAVSRRHAAVERKPEGYYIVDLNSAAGTFLNGQKLPPNTPFKLERGDRISFGFSGADYVWET